MKCPACKNPLCANSVGDLILNVCFGGCGGIWFDARELESVTARSATALHSILQVSVNNVKPTTEPRPCPRCANQMLDRKWFSSRKQAEIEQCRVCRGVWVDAGIFSHICEEINGAKSTSPIWPVAMAEAIAITAERRSP